MDAAAIPKLTQDTLKVLRDTAVDVLTILEQRGLRRPVTQVAELFFGAGGMRQTLKRIADGKGSQDDLELLKHQLSSTEPGVSSIITTLNNGWDKLIKLPDGLEVANEIGNLIHSPLGKMGICRAIDEVTRGDPRSPETMQKAEHLCGDIDRFNEGLINLHKRVLKPAAEMFQARRGRKR